jgi:outer membrane protein OmpA-like peptidoglycan-associated protein
MKRSVVLLILSMVVAAAGQQEQAPQASAPEVKLTNIVGVRQQAPTYSDVYCAGFITHQPLQRVGYVAGGWGTPHQVRFADRDYVYIEGSGFSIGAQYALVRQERDLNRYEAFRGQYALLRQLGRPYADVGRVRVVAIHNNIAITQVEFNCTDIMDGDAAIPFAERQIPALRGKINFDRFAPPNGKLTGKIVMAKGFDTMAGMGRKVYLNVGANQGVKVGDYFRAVRTYDSYRNDEVDNVSFKASYYDDNQVPAGMFQHSRLREFPRISLGEMVVLSVTPTSSTAMVTLSLEDIHLGDGVELEAAPPEMGEAEPVASPLPQETAQTPEILAAQEAAPPAAAPAQPLAIACSAEPAAVHAGESSTITCEASSADHRPLSFTFSATKARLVQRDNTAVLDTRDLAAGAVEVLATVSDDHNRTATARTTVNVDAPRAALVPTKLNFVSFARDSARLDNSGKAVLDGIALRLERDTDSSLVVLGLVESGENRELAQQRAASAADYLTKDKGIDDKRLQLRDGGEYGGKAELWMVPPGTRLQEADLKH